MKIAAQHTMKKAFKTLFALAALLAACVLPARAIVIVNATESGGNVVFAGGGTFNLTDLLLLTPANVTAGINPSLSIAFFGTTPGTSFGQFLFRWHYRAGTVRPGRREYRGPRVR